MQPETRDLASLWDIRQAARSIMRFGEAATLDSFAADEMLKSAVERQLILIGEAARRVSDQFRSAHPEIPWREMIGQRNVLVHGHGDVSDDLVWRVIADDLPTLVEELDRLIPNEPTEPG